MKKQHRFFVTTIPATNTFKSSDVEVVHMIRTVLRLVPGETCHLFTDDSDDLVVKIVSIEKNGVTFEKISVKPKIVIPLKTIAAISITKRDTFELAVQKLTELGVSMIIPIISDRTIKQSLRIDRLQKISDEAVEQSGHSQKVTISNPKYLFEAIGAHKNIQGFYFDTDTEEKLHKSQSSVIFYIGPEGGWSDKEKDLFKINNVSPVTLGDTVLRSETAAIVAAYTLIWQ